MLVVVDAEHPARRYASLTNNPCAAAYPPATESLLQQAQEADLATANAGLITDVIVSLAGTQPGQRQIHTYCRAIQRQLADADFVHDLGDVDLNISGCERLWPSPRWAHRHTGVNKKGQEFYQISLRTCRTLEYPSFAGANNWPICSR